MFYFLKLLLFIGQRSTAWVHGIILKTYKVPPLKPVFPNSFVCVQVHSRNRLDSEMIWGVGLPLRVFSSFLSSSWCEGLAVHRAGPWPLLARKPPLWPPEVSIESKLKVISNPYLPKNYLSHILPQGLYKELI